VLILLTFYHCIVSGKSSEIAEARTFNQRVDGSNPSGLTNNQRLEGLSRSIRRPIPSRLAHGSREGRSLPSIVNLGSPSAPAAHGLYENQSGAMVAFQPPELKFAPLAESLNKVRTAAARPLRSPAQDGLSRSTPVGIWDHIGMLTHHVPAESRDRDSDQRSEHEEQREPGARDNEA
jgi:hypothetical protein